MDAKSRAEFINTVTSTEKHTCPKCGASNANDSRFCITCGAKMEALTEKKNEEPAFEPVREATPPPAKYVEPSNAFAQGLPEWNLEPPQIMVRRH